MAAVFRPVMLQSVLRSVPKSSVVNKTIRSFHQTSTRTLSRPSTILTKGGYGFRAYSNRTIDTTINSVNPTAKGPLSQRLIYGAAIFGGTLLAANLVFNRETREGSIPLAERAYLNETFLHTGLGVGIIGIAARTFYSNGFTLRLMASNPWLVMGGGLVASIATMMGTMAIDPDNYVPKYALWTGFNVTQAALLSPLLFVYSPALLARAGLYTVAMMGSLAFVGATAKTDKYLYLGGPLLAGVAIVAVSGFAPLVLPATAVRTLAFTENLWLYGGLAVFGGFTLYDVQKVLHKARLAERGLIKRDTVAESISLELDFINIFVRMVMILGNSQRRK